MPLIQSKKDVKKPPYRVPSMSEITAIPWNGLNVVSTFAGCGGSSLGYRMAGFRILWASEFIDAARDCYSANMVPGTVIDGRDIRNVKSEEILERIGLKIGELDLLDGSPPCASFSTAGKRQKDWGKVKKYSDKVQRTDDLFLEFIRILRGLKPRVFVAENVSGLVKGVAKGYFLEILKELKNSGYRVKCKVLDAQWLGVPQARQRTIFIGVREDLKIDPIHPSPLSYRYALKEALPHIMSYKASGRPNFWKDANIEPYATVTQSAANLSSTAYLSANGYVKVSIINNRIANPETEVPIDEPSMTVRAMAAGHLKIIQQQGSAGIRKKEINIDKPLLTVCGTQSQQFILEKTKEDSDADISRFSIGDEWDHIEPGEQSDKYFSLVKTHPDKPSPTVTQTAGNSGAAGVVLHIEKRKFYISELKRICAFPDNFKLSGTYAQQWERLGRAVPPLMMKAIAETVRDKILISSLGEKEIERRKTAKLIRPLLIGQAPSIDVDPVRVGPFRGASGKKLAEIVGVSLNDLLTRVEAVNLLPEFPGRDGKGDAWNASAAARAASLLNTRGRTVILCGEKVAAAFGLVKEPIPGRVERDGTTFVLIPHPSPINLRLNDAKIIARMRELLRAVLGLDATGKKKRRKS